MSDKWNDLEGRCRSSHAIRSSDVLALIAELRETSATLERERLMTKGLVSGLYEDRERLEVQFKDAEQALDEKKAAIKEWPDIVKMFEDKLEHAEQALEYYASHGGEKAQAALDRLRKGRQSPQDDR